MSSAGRNGAAGPIGGPPAPDAPPRPVPVAPPSAAVIAQVRRSCAAVADRPVALAEAFYQHLFDMAPRTRAMFPPDMTAQMQKMTDTLLNGSATDLTTRAQTPIPTTRPVPDNAVRVPRPEDVTDERVPTRPGWPEEQGPTR